MSKKDACIADLKTRVLTFDLAPGATLNNVPAFGEVDDGLFSACCQNGLGTVQGTLGGMMAAEMAVGYCSDMLAELQALDAPKRLPPEPVATLGARARLAWGERQAGVEL